MTSASSTVDEPTGFKQGQTDFVVRRKGNYDWKIPTILYFSGETLKQLHPQSAISPVFLDEESGDKWTVHIQLPCLNDVNVSLELTSCRTHKTHAFFEFILVRCGRLLGTAAGSHTFSDVGLRSSYVNLYRQQSCGANTTSLQDEITIYFTVESKELLRTTHVAVKESKHKLLLSLSRDILSLRESRSFSDVVIKVDGKEIPAHRNILASRSQYFATMFTSGFREGRDNTVEITDFSASVIEKLVDFMYTARVPDFTIDSTYELLMASDKYDVAGLKSCCADFLGNALSCATAIETLRYSDMCNETELKEKALQFICQNIGDFEGTKAFAILQDANLFAEILGFMSALRKSVNG